MIGKPVVTQVTGCRLPDSLTSIPRIHKEPFKGGRGP